MVGEAGSVWLRRALAVAWLAVVWVLLWGRLDALVVGSGVLVGAAVALLSRLPPLTVRTRVRWRRLPWAVLRFVVDVFRSSWDVAVTTARKGRHTRSSILALRLPTGTSDAALLLACNRISLEPGTIVVDVDRRRELVYVYQLDTVDREAAERVRDDAQRLLDGIVATFPPTAPAPDGGDGLRRPVGWW